MKKQMRSIGIAYGLLSVFCGAACTQPPTMPKPALPPLSLGEIEKNFGAPKLISVNFQNTPIKDALNEVGRQAGIRIEGANLKPTVTLQFKDAPFWTVMDALLVPNGLRVTGRSFWRGENMNFPIPPDLQVSERGRAGNANKIPRIAPQQIHPYVALLWAGATRTQTRSLEYGSSLSVVGDGPRTQNLSLHSAVLLDPSLNETPMEVRLRLESVVDGIGQNVSIISSHSQGSGYDSSLMKEIGAMLLLSGTENNLTKLSLVKGAVVAAVEMRHEVWEVLDLMKATGATKTFKSVNGDLTLTLLSITKENGEYQMRLQGNRRQVSQSREVDIRRRLFESPSQNWMKRLQVFDANGNQYYFRIANSSQNGDNVHVALTLAEQHGGEQVEFGIPDKLIIEVPTEIRLLEIPFEVKDLPLP